MRRTAALLLSAAVLLLTPTAARAETGLAAADPAPGASLAAMPAAVTLRFPDDVDAGSSHVAVTAPDGSDLADGEPGQPDAAVLRQPVRVGVAGDVTVAYHVILGDGTSVTGAYRFSAGTGTAPAPLDLAGERAATSAVTGHRHEVDPLSAVLLVIDGAVVLALAGLLVLRPRDGSPNSLRLDERR